MPGQRYQEFFKVLAFLYTTVDILRTEIIIIFDAPYVFTDILHTPPLTLSNRKLSSMPLVQHSVCQSTAPRFLVLSFWSSYPRSNTDWDMKFLTHFGELSNI